MSKFYIFFITFLLSGCLVITPPKTVKSLDGLEKNKGIVVANIHSNIDEYHGIFKMNVDLLFFKNNEEYVSKRLSMTENDSLQIIYLPEGEYHWTKMEFGTTRYWDLDKSTGFSVKAGEVTYIGDIYISTQVNERQVRASFDVRNNANSTSQLVKNKFPAIPEFNEKLATIAVK